ncbi:MAG: 30S ribosomal protein S1 [Candidatus Midichloria sp.]|nr:30S ribosomal protein S1 [Candidatus Midichloria sp.]
MNLQKNITAEEQLIADEFEKLFYSYLDSEKKEGQVIKGAVIGVERDSVLIDVGLKSEGMVPKSQFGNIALNVGDEVEVYVERFEGKGGRIILSREKALRDIAWSKFEQICTQGENVDGVIIGRVKGGFAVELSGIIAFLPGSQVDIRPVKDISVLLGLAQPFKILKVDRENGNVVVSRRAILEDSRKEARQEQLANIQEGSVLEGTVKNLTDYGVFIDLGFMDGLLHITDISWSKISHPSEVLSIGQVVKVIVIKYSAESQRVSLGMKQLEANPWDQLAEKYKVGTKFKGTVTTVVDYGAFVEIELNVEGLVYHTEMSWNAKNMHPRKLVKPGDEVEVIILEIDISKHRISLSMKQCKENPWAKFAENYPIGSTVSGIIKNIADFGMFMTIGDAEQDEIDVLIPATEISWDKSPEEALKDYAKGSLVTGVVLNIDLERERVTVSIKQVAGDAVVAAAEKLVNAGIVTCVVTNIKKDGIEVEAAEGLTAFVKKSDLSKHKDEQHPERFAVGDKVDAKVLGFDKTSRQLLLSIKAHEIEEEKKAIAEFGSTASGASLGDILGAALKKDK